MNFIKKFIIAIIFSSFFSQILVADTPFFLDFKYILNESDAGKKAQIFLKNKLEKGIQDLKNKEKAIQNEEKKIIQQKKIISPEEYKKKSCRIEKKSNFSSKRKKYTFEQRIPTKIKSPNRNT